MDKLRYFNQLIDNGTTVTKTSTYTEKLSDEIYWYRTLPVELHNFIPKLAEFETFPPSLTLEKIQNGDYGTAFVFDNEINWEEHSAKILNLLLYLHSFKQKVKQRKEHQYLMYIEKTRSRILEYYNCEHLKSFSNNPIINGVRLKGITSFLDELETFCFDLIDNCEFTIIHGDYFLGNLLITDDHPKMIDPRGKFGRTRGITGDPKYDWAKLWHDIFWDYNLINYNETTYKIINNGFYYNIIETDQQKINKKILQKSFIEQCPYDLNVINKICALLFLSMIPLHCDDQIKQQVFVARGLEIFNNVI